MPDVYIWLYTLARDALKFGCPRKTDLGHAATARVSHHDNAVCRIIITVPTTTIFRRSALGQGGYLQLKFDST